MSEQTENPSAIPYGVKNPFPAAVKSMVNLNGQGSAKETFHLELSLAGSGMEYVPGDVAGVFPTNCLEVVDDFLQVSGFSGDEPVEDGDVAISLREVLSTKRNITTMNLALMKKYAAVAENSDLDAFVASGDKEKINHWLWGREIRDLLIEYPAKQAISLEQTLKLLRKMPPRLYSIASSLAAHPEEVHLTVGAVEFETEGLKRKGVCSTYLCQRVADGDTVPVYMHHNKNFGMPEDPDVPMIMIGPGTGIAPFRAFIEERMATGAKGKNWLFFGDQHFNTDFLYQLEWMKYLKSGILTRMDVAFSRDQDFKIYVQDRMRENSKDIYDWLQEGAHFYVCGDANRMAKDVHQALIDLHAEHGDMSAEDAEAAVEELKKSRRYQRDVY